MPSDADPSRMSGLRTTEVEWWVPYAVEFLATLLFQAFGSSMAPTMDAVYNGVVLSVLIFMSAKASGGVMNPAVALLLWVVGELPWQKAAGYAAAELLGAVFGALLGWLINIGYSYDSWSIDHTGPGCGPVDVAVTNYAPIFLWELLGTFVLSLTVCVTAVSKPGFGDLAPIAIGASIFVSVAAGGGYTGGFFNCARYLGPSLVFGCGLNLAWLYLPAQLLGALAAGAAFRVALEPQASGCFAGMDVARGQLLSGVARVTQ